MYRRQPSSFLNRDSSREITYTRVSFFRSVAPYDVQQVFFCNVYFILKIVALAQEDNTAKKDIA